MDRDKLQICHVSQSTNKHRAPLKAITQPLWPYVRLLLIKEVHRKVPAGKTAHTQCCDTWVALAP